MEIIDTEIFLYAEDNGGRHSPILGKTDQSFYMPHIVLGDPNQKIAITAEIDGKKNVCTEQYLGVRFLSTPEYEYLPVEKLIRIQMELLYADRVDYSEAKLDSTFTIREGAKVIGYGKITNREK